MHYDDRPKLDCLFGRVVAGDRLRSNRQVDLVQLDAIDAREQHGVSSYAVIRLIVTCTLMCGEEH